MICIKKFFWRKNGRLDVWGRFQVAKGKKKNDEIGGMFSKGKKRKAWEKSEKAEGLEKFEKKGNWGTVGFWKKFQGCKWAP